MPGYTGPYSLPVRCLGETLGMGLAMFIGLGVVANEVLPKAKGSGSLGFGWISFGFGLAFFIPVQMFGYMTIYLNPGVLIAAYINGYEDATAVFSMIICDFIGAFLGAIFMFLHYAPHFMTVPEPPAPTKEMGLLRTRDAYRESALQYISYSTDPEPKPDDSWGAPIRDAVAVITGDVDGVYGNSTNGPAGEATDRGALLDKKSNVETMQEKYRNEELGKLVKKATKSNPEVKVSAPEPTPQAPGTAIQAVHKDGRTAPSLNTSIDVGRSAASFDSLKGTSSMQLPAFAQAQIEEEAAELARLYQAALTADQNAKLAVFATRPAIKKFIFNFIAETQSSFTVVLAVLLFGHRASMLYTDEQKAYITAWQGFMEALLVCGLVLGLGGPTGLAANAARDLGPRIAHLLLPISNKGSSEMKYGMVPVMANFIGGALAGGVYYGLALLNKSDMTDQYPMCKAM